jgi:transposase
MCYAEGMQTNLVRRCPMMLYGGIDLHSNNSYIGIVDGENRVIYKNRHRNDLPVILSALAPYKDELGAVAVESTFNWYWLVDGLKDAGYPVHLANPAAIKEYKGLKHKDDKKSALWLANLLRLKILPEGYIYPKEERPVRDLLRKRLHLVRHRTSHILSIKNILSRNLGATMKSDDIKTLTHAEVEKIFQEPHLRLSVIASLSTIHHLSGQIKEIEKVILGQARLRDEFKGLLIVPGIGTTLALTIMLEVGRIDRFSGVGHYASYCRCVESIRRSNEKKTGEGNRKNGNKYLSWAYVEAANFAKRYYPAIKRYYEKKAAGTNKIVAIKAVSHKLARASYYVLRDQAIFDEKRLFG